MSQTNLSPLETRTIPEGDNVTNPYCDDDSSEHVALSMPSVASRRNQKLTGKFEKYLNPAKRSNLQSNYDEDEYLRA